MSDDAGKHRGSNRTKSASKNPPRTPFSPPLVKGGRAESLVRISGCTREGRFIRAISAELEEHCGGSPSIAERMLITTISLHWYRISQLTPKLLMGTATDYEQKLLLDLDNALRKSLAELGIKRPEQAPQDVTNYLEGKFSEVG